MECEEPAGEGNGESHPRQLKELTTREQRGTARPLGENPYVDTTARHLRLLTETIAAVNSSLDLQEVLELVASKVADALGTDACFVYLYDERSDELVLRAT